MAKQTYNEKLQHPKWQIKRLEIIKRDGGKCLLCGDTETMLQIHHLKYTGEPWDAPNEDLVTLCKHCHCYVGLGGKGNDDNAFTFERTEKIIKISYEGNPENIELISIVKPGKKGNAGIFFITLDVATNTYKNFVLHRMDKIKGIIDFIKN